MHKAQCIALFLLNCHSLQNTLSISCHIWKMGTEAGMRRLKALALSGLSQSIHCGKSFSGEILQGNLPNIVFRALRQARLDPNYLELEITESLSIDDIEHIQEQIHEIVNLGISIAIDNFGTGYANLNYLAKFNASSHKIDMSLVRNMLNQRGDGTGMCNRRCSGS